MTFTTITHKAEAEEFEIVLDAIVEKDLGDYVIVGRDAHRIIHNLPSFTPLKDHSNEAYPHLEGKYKTLKIYHCDSFPHDEYLFAKKGSGENIYEYFPYNNNKDIKENNRYKITGKSNDEKDITIEGTCTKVHSVFESFISIDFNGDDGVEYRTFITKDGCFPFIGIIGPVLYAHLKDVVLIEKNNK